MTRENGAEEIRTPNFQLAKLATLPEIGLKTGSKSTPTTAPSNSASNEPGGGDDAELALIVGAWRTLAPAIRAGIVAMVKAGGASS